MSALVVQGDALHLPLPDDSVDLIVTSPPYFALRTYQDGGAAYDGQLGTEPTVADYLDGLLRATLECVRVLKPTGSLWVNLGDRYSDRAGPAAPGSSDRQNARQGKGARVSTTGVAPRKSLLGLPWRYALSCMDDLGLILRSDVVWNKTNALPESVTDRVRRSHEVLFHFTLQADYYAELDDVRQPHAGRPRVPGGGRTYKALRPDGEKDTNLAVAAQHPRGRLPSSVWDIATVRLPPRPEALGVAHPATFPTELPRRIVLGWSPPGGVVLDPFGGAGTTAMVAAALGRRAVSVDLSADYCALAAWRVSDHDQLEKVRTA